MEEYTKIPEVNHYLKSVKNEIQEKQIQESLLLELYQHMEDSATEQIENGMSEEAAWHYALASMGDASETGKALNRVHQKRNTLLPLLVTGISVLIALLFSFSLIQYHGMLKNNIIYRIYACVIILSLVYFGNHILKKEKLVYALYTLLFVFTIISGSHTLLFAIFMLSILILTYWEIRPESYFSFASIIIYAVMMWLCKYPHDTYTLTAAFILTISFSSIIISSKFNTKKIKYIKVLSIIVLFTFIYYPSIYSRWEAYIKVFSIESMNIFSLLKNACFIGKSFVCEGLPYALPNYYTDYHILYWILSYGIFPAVILLTLASGMYVILYATIKKISNHKHQLLAIGCFTCLLMQFLLYILGNFGLLFLNFPSFPVISKGISSITINAIFIGIIFSLYRYDKTIVIT